MASTIKLHKEHPILFSGEMVRAIIDGRKTQTRRVIKESLQMCDVFEKSKPSDGLDAQRVHLFKLIRETPYLDWLLLTKRPENIAEMLPTDWGAGYENAWLGTTVENQAVADTRIPTLLSVPARVRFLSCEPLIERVDLAQYIKCEWSGEKKKTPDGWVGAPSEIEYARLRRGIDWVIVGGESGPNARPMQPSWVRSLRDQCLKAGVAFFFKQWGRWMPMPGEPDRLIASPSNEHDIPLLDGITWQEFPSA